LRHVPLTLGCDGAPEGQRSLLGGGTDTSGPDDPAPLREATLLACGFLLFRFVHQIDDAEEAARVYLTA
jgi:hypothetical protein